MKIAIDCRLWNEGGVGRYLRNLVHYLKLIDNHNHYCLYFFNQAPLKTQANFAVRTTQAKWHSVAEQWQFYQQLNNERFDLVHFPYFSHPILYNRPFVITVHDLTIKHFPTGKATTKSSLIYWLKRWGYQKVLAHAVYQSRHILVPSRFVKADLLVDFTIPKEKISVTHEGVGFEFLKAKAKLPALQVENFLLYVGNFYPHKNVELLLLAFAKVKDRTLKLILVGPHDFFSQRIKNRAQELGLAKQVIFQYSATESELIWFYQNARALVFPSLFEGFGLPIVEAAYYNCPLLLSRIAVFAEIAPKTAVFFDPKDADDLAQKIRTLKPGQKTRPPDNYFRQYSFKQLALKTLAVYQQQTG